MQSSNEIMEKVKSEVRLSMSPISREDFLRVTKIDKKTRWGDAISGQAVENGPSQYFVPMDRYHAYVSSRLAHIIVNPSSRKSDASALIETYVHATDVDGAANNSLESVGEFLSELCQISKRNKRGFLAESEFDREYHSNKNSVQLLVGNRGIGKTFFLNHVLAKYSEFLDREKIIWVRINLVDTFGENDDLIHWMYAQATKIVLRYYCKESKYFDSSSPKEAFDVIGIVNSYLESLDDPYRRKCEKDAFQELLDIFVRNLTDEPIRIGMCPKGLVRKIWETTVRGGGYSFIVAFDGLDRLESSYASHKKFTSLVSSMRALQNQAEVVPASFVVTCRKKTAERLSMANAYPFSEFSVKRLTLGAGNFEKIFDLRLDFLERSAKEVLSKSGDVDGHFKERDLRKFRSYIAKDKDEFSMFGSNIRAMMQTVQLRYKEFVSYHPDDYGSQDYRWVESCMKMGLRYLPKYYQYKLGEDPSLPYICNPRESAYDNRLLPSIFYYPYFEFDDNIKKMPSFYSALVGLRVLQLAVSSCNLHAAKEIASRVTVDCISEILTDCFGYPGALTRTVVREFSDFELIDVECNQLAPSNTPNSDGVVSITSKGRYVLEHCLSDIAYYAISAMRIPMRSGILVPGLDVPPFFHVYAFRSHLKLSLQHDLGRWVQTKAINAINLYNLLDYADREQMEMLVAKEHSGKIRVVSNRLGKGVTWKGKIYKNFVDSSVRLSFFREVMIHKIIGMISSISDVGDEVKEISLLLERNRNVWWSH